MADIKEIAATASVDIGKNITEILEKLAHQIGTTAEEVFPWYVKQQVLEGWLYLVTDAVAFVLGLVFLLGFFSKADWKSEGWNRYAVLSVIGAVVTTIAFGFFIFGFSNSVMHINNPNYYALKSMINDMARLLR